MIELELLGTHTNGSQLVFTDPDGARYLITIDDALRAAVRREAMQLTSSPTTTDTLQPREIQSLLRAGMTPEEIASTYSTDIQRVLRLVAPIRAEQLSIIRQALAAPVGSHEDSPTLEDLAINRLATRSVDPMSFHWTATRLANSPWQLHLSFAQAAEEHVATWDVTPRGELVRAVNDEAKWLTETTTPTPPLARLAEESAARRRGETGDAHTVAGDAPAPIPADTAGARATSVNTAGMGMPGTDVESLLDDLAAARGRRQPLVIDDGEDDDTQVTMFPSAPFMRLHSTTGTQRDHDNALTPSTNSDRTSAVDTAASTPSPTTTTEANSASAATTPVPDSGTDKASTDAPDQGEDHRGDNGTGGPTLPGLESLSDDSNPGDSRQEGAGGGEGKSRKNGRPSVPSWADIILGTTSRPQ